MHIGLTYDLRAEYLAAGFGEEETAEFDSLETIDALAAALWDLGHEVDRVGNARQLVSRLAQGATWDGVFNICEGLYGMGREAQVPAILDAFRIPYTFSDPLVMALCLHKGLTKTVVRQAGIPTPDFIVVDDAQSIAPRGLSYPVFAKPIGEGTGKGVTPSSKICDASDLAIVCDQLVRRFRQPVLVEQYLPGREFTVGLLGTGQNAQVIGTLEIVLLPGAEREVYSFVNKERCEQLVEYRRVDARRDAEVHRAEQIALAAWQTLGCRDGGRIDLRSDAHGQPQFIEANPLAGLHPTHSDLPMLATAVGMRYVELIGRILDSARARWASHASCITS
jgi:D-alanine-D-alanine ligase